MAANGISTLATKELRQKAKLDQVSLDRAGQGNARHYYDIAQLPTRYSGNIIVDNTTDGNVLTVGRPWITQPSGIASLFATGEKGAWYDPSDITTLFQDVAGTIPVTATGQAVARINDKSGNNAHATQSDPTKRPTYYNYPGTAYSALRFDGVDDFMVTGSLNFTGTNKVTATTGFHLIPPGTGSSRIMIEFGTGVSNGSFYITAKNNMRDHSIGARGTASLYVTFPNNDPQHDVITGLYDLSQSDRTLGLIPRMTGYLATSLAYIGTATGSTASMFGNLPLYIGARAGTSFFFTGNFYGAVIRGATSTQPEITLAETWTASKLY